MTAGLRRLRRGSTTSRSTTSRCAPARRSRRAAACWSPRRPAPARRMVGEFAVHLALADGPQVLLHHPDQGAVEPEVRTTWSRRYGADQVGLLTGDNAINGEAPVVVMTTEVLRNMLYAGSRDAARAAASW